MIMHNFCSENRQPVDEKGDPVPYRDGPPDESAHCEPTDIDRPACRRQPGKNHPKNKTVDHIAIFHYVTKSKEDFRIKINRRKSGFKRDWKYFRQVQGLSLIHI